MSRQRMVAAGLLLTLTALGTTGCRELTRASFSDSRTESVTINEIRIEGDSGSVTLDRSGSQVQIERTVFYRETKPSNRSDSVADGALVLNTSCGNNCEIQYKVHVPAAVKVTGHLDSGSIDVSDVTSATLNTSSGRVKVATVSGDVTATTDSGRIDVADVKGKLNLKTESGSVHADRIGDVVTVRTDSGSINANSLSGSQTTAKSESGSITVDVTNAQNVKLTTDSGRIRVTVPKDAKYNVQHHTDSGRVDVQVATDPAAKYTLDLSSQSGSISVDPAR